jgi:hypothetical protein
VRLITLLANSLLLMIEGRVIPKDSPARSVPQTFVCHWDDSTLEAPSLVVAARLIGVEQSEGRARRGWG